MMKTVALNERILDTLRALIEHHSSSRCVAEQMGQAHNYVARILRGETKLRLDVLERILEALDVPYGFFMETVAARDPDSKDAAAFLRFLRGSAPCEQPFLDDVRPTLEVLQRMPLVDGADFPSRRGELERLETLRRSDKQAAEQGLRDLIFEMLTDPPVPVPRQLLEDLAIALATFGTVQRFAGRRSDSARAFEAAFEVAGRSGRPNALGHVYRKAAYLLRDFSQAEAGIRFLEHAREHFLQTGAVERCAEIFSDRAILRVHLGDFEKAVKDYSAALATLGEDEDYQRHVAYSGLSHCHEQLGDLPRALDAADRAEALHDGTESLGLAYLVWNRGNLAAALGENLLAGEQLRRAIDLLARFAEPVDVALCALDLATLLVAAGETRQVRALADEMLAWLPAFRGSRVADAVITELIRCAKWGELTSRVLDGARQRLESARSG